MTRLRWMALALTLLGAVAHAQSSGTAPDAQGGKLDKNKLSYAIGYQIGSQFASGDPDVDIAVMQRAIQDAYSKRKPTVSMQDMHEQLRTLDKHMHDKAVAEFQRVAQANAQRSAAYLASNRQKPGVVQLPSGIQYQVLNKGDGRDQPALNSTVTVNFRAMLIDGTEFDSSWAHGAPVSFIVNNKVIPGWQDVIQRMHVGDKWRVVIPPALAYGERGDLPRIGPNEALVFEIELLEIKQ
ncbi:MULTISPECIES: FKBP-type peptidyl-prolyl cis-trans isomerase [Dyella]|uniref:Peptidyl-prolyl cis-trans isomerase n=2 Tax=Dyella TaxID=231454 RepID=A0A4R0Z2H1_9GAMM|nr:MULTISPECIES: FKBP-type peptidyl-prolyl cis-trans isomerase [Dyella]TBR39022.1 FKBP-type peptidyl-prolyl cis-trans isomerase [Dyella terrae]TCI13386.1 FKBP-type peptidyl-prolyl cis-trans isomerase [Dyella soli]